MTDTLTAPRTKGPLVWLDLDQQALDDAYDQAVYAPNREQVHARRAANSAVARAVLGEPLRLQYGTSEIEGIDVLRCDAEGLIEDFTVMLRPLSGLLPFSQAMGEKLAQAGLQTTRV